MTANEINHPQYHCQHHCHKNIFLSYKKKFKKMILRNTAQGKLQQLWGLTDIKGKPFVIVMTMMVLLTSNEQFRKGNIGSWAFN